MDLKLSMNSWLQHHWIKYINALILWRSEPFYGNVKQLQYFDSALADTQLEQLTSWQSFRDMANGQLYTIE